MITVAFEKKSGKLCQCTVKGHAGFADAGQDIVCAAVSSAVQLTANLITEQFQEQADVSADNHRILIRLEQPQNGNGFRILEGLLVHLQCISEDYPGTIQIKIS